MSHDKNTASFLEEEEIHDHYQGTGESKNRDDDNRCKEHILNIDEATLS